MKNYCGLNGYINAIYTIYGSIIDNINNKNIDFSNYYLYINYLSIFYLFIIFFLN